MKRILVLLILLHSIATTAQSWKWARGGVGGCEGYFSAIDSSGSLYIAGSGSFSSIDGGYVVKYDSSGTQVWAVGVEGDGYTAFIQILGLTTDQFGNEYLLGQYDSTVIFGSYILYTPGAANNYYFIAKISANGIVKWIKNMGNVACDQPAYASISNFIITDINGDVYVTCPFSMDATIGSYTLTNAAADSSTDILVAKFDSSGNVMWVKNYGGKNYDYAAGISVTPSLNIYVSGAITSDTVSFGSTFLVDTGSLHNNTVLYLAKLDSSGNTIWVKGAGGNNPFDLYYGITTNSAEDVFLTGCYFGQSLTLDSDTLPFPTGQYGFLSKYDSSGGASWVKVIEGQLIAPYTVAIDPCGNIWISSGDDFSITDSVTIDGHVLSPISGPDPMFIAGWSSTGVFISAIALSSGGDDMNSISIDKCGNIFVEGDYDMTTFIVGNDTLVAPTGEETNFVAKFVPNAGCNCGSELEVEAQPLDLSIVLYPSPTQNELTVASSDRINTIAISNILGQTVYSKICNTDQIHIDVEGLPAGVYFAKINGTEVRKFIKQ